MSENENQDVNDQKVLCIVRYFLKQDLLKNKPMDYMQTLWMNDVLSGATFEDMHAAFKRLSDIKKVINGTAVVI